MNIKLFCDECEREICAGEKFKQVNIDWQEVEYSPGNAAGKTCTSTADAILTFHMKCTQDVTV